MRRDEVLLGRRGSHKSFPGRWDVPGGHVEAGESFEGALVRELGEELAILPQEWRLLRRLPFEARDGWSELLIYRVERWSGEPRVANDEHTEVRWFPLADAAILEPLAIEEYRPILSRLASE